MSKFANSFKVVILALVLAVGVSYLYADWEPPTVAPTASDVYAPINTGPTDQVKLGGIGADSFAATGDIVSLSGVVKARELCIGDDCRSEWPEMVADLDGGGTDGLGSSRLVGGAVSAYGASTCVIAYSGVPGEGTVYCSGHNSWAQLGLGTTAHRNIFSSITAFNAGGVVKMIGSASHFCALDKNTYIWCWGYNGYGQIGNGTKVLQKTPNKVGSVNNLGGINGFFDLDTSVVYYDDDGSTRLPGFTCGVKGNPVTGGEVWCWGYNGHGQLGRGFAGETPPRAWISGPTPAKPSPTPAQVMGIGTSTPGAVKVVVGGLQYGYACAITNADHSDLAIDGDQFGDIVKCWGANDFGQLGDGTTGDPSPRMAGYFENRTPVRANIPGVTGLPGGKRVVDIAVTKASNEATTCVIVETNLGSAEGEVYCWGDNTYGQAGAPFNASTLAGTNPVLIVNRVPGITNAKALRSGSHAYSNGKNFCAILGDNTAMCWGNDTKGQLGDGVARETTPVSSDFSYTPKQLKMINATTNMTQIIDLQLSQAHSPSNPNFGCAISKTGTYMDPITNSISDMGDVYCWGANNYGQLGLPPQGTLAAGRADGSAHPIPTKVNFPASTDGVYRATKLIMGGAYDVCAIISGIQKPDGSMVIDPDTGSTFEYGKMFCWGYNKYGSQGRGGASNATYIGLPGFPI